MTIQVSSSLCVMVLLLRLSCVALSRVLEGEDETASLRKDSVRCTYEDERRGRKLMAQVGTEDRYLDGTVKYYENGTTTWQNWGLSFAPVPLIDPPAWPKTKVDVKRIILEAARDGKRLRVAGHGHSWTPIVCSPGERLIFSRDFQQNDGSRIEFIPPTMPWAAPKVKVTAGVRAGELTDFFDEFVKKSPPSYPGIMADAILENARYGGLIAPGCHGTGWDVQTISDFVESVTIINYEGEEIVYDSSHPHFNAARLSFGLLGVIFDITFRLDNHFDAPAVEVSHSKPQLRTYFADTSTAREALKKLVTTNYAVEFFWFPLNSGLPLFWNWRWTSWDPLNDKLWIKVFKRVPVPEGGVSTKQFSDPSATLKDAMSMNTGNTAKQLSQAAQEKAHSPAISFLNARSALLQQDSFTEITTLPRAIHYQKSIDGMLVNNFEMCIKVDLETFENVQLAWRTINSILSSWINKRRVNPCNVAVGWRFTAHSDIPMSPAYGAPGEHFCWIEIVALASSKYWEEFQNEVAGAWMKIKGAGGVSSKPHWTKWNVYPGKSDLIGDYAKNVSAEQIASFRDAVRESDPVGMFHTEFLKKLFDL